MDQPQAVRPRSSNTYHGRLRPPNERKSLKNKSIHLKESFNGHLKDTSHLQLSNKKNTHVLKEQRPPAHQHTMYRDSSIESNSKKEDSNHGKKQGMKYKNNWMEQLSARGLLDVKPQNNNNAVNMSQLSNRSIRSSSIKSYQHMFSPKTILLNRKQSIQNQQNQIKLIKIIETCSDQDSSQMKIISFTDRAAIDNPLQTIFNNKQTHHGKDHSKGKKHKSLMNINQYNHPSQNHEYQEQSVSLNCTEQNGNQKIEDTSLLSVDNHLGLSQKQLQSVVEGDIIHSEQPKKEPSLFHLKKEKNEVSKRLECNSQSSVESKFKRNHKRIENLRRKLFSRNNQDQLSKFGMSQKEQSKSLNEKKNNFIVESEAINLSNVFTLQKVDIDKQENAGTSNQTNQNQEQEQMEQQQQVNATEQDLEQLAAKIQIKNKSELHNKCQKQLSNETKDTFKDKIPILMPSLENSLHPQNERQDKKWDEEEKITNQNMNISIEESMTRDITQSNRQYVNRSQMYVQMKQGTMTDLSSIVMNSPNGVTNFRDDNINQPAINNELFKIEPDHSYQDDYDFSAPPIKNLQNVLDEDAHHPRKSLSQKKSRMSRNSSERSSFPRINYESEINMKLRFNHQQQDNHSCIVTLNNMRDPRKRMSQISSQLSKLNKTEINNNNNNTPGTIKTTSTKIGFNPKIQLDMLMNKSSRPDTMENYQTVARISSISSESSSSVSRQQQLSLNNNNINLQNMSKFNKLSIDSPFEQALITFDCQKQQVKPNNEEKEKPQKGTKRSKSSGQVQSQFVSRIPKLKKKCKSPIPGFESLQRKGNIKDLEINKTKTLKVINKQKNQKPQNSNSHNSPYYNFGRSSDVLTSSQINNETSIKNPSKNWNHMKTNQINMTVLQHVPLTKLASKQKDGRKSQN